MKPQSRGEMWPSWIGFGDVFIVELILLSPERRSRSARGKLQCSRRGAGSFLPEEIGFALIHWEFRELFGVLFPVNFPNEK